MFESHKFKMDICGLKYYSENTILTVSDITAKIKNNPSNREMYMMEMMKENNVTPVKSEKVSFSGEKSIIKNITGTKILLDFHAEENRNVKNKSEIIKPMILEDYLFKSDLKPEELNSSIIKKLYMNGSIEDITESQMTEEIKSIKKEKEVKMSAKSIKSSGGVSVREINTKISNNIDNLSDLLYGNDEDSEFETLDVDSNTRITDPLMSLIEGQIKE